MSTKSTRTEENKEKTVMKTKKNAPAKGKEAEMKIEETPVEGTYKNMTETSAKKTPTVGEKENIEVKRKENSNIDNMISHNASSDSSNETLILDDEYELSLEYDYRQDPLFRFLESVRTSDDPVENRVRETEALYKLERLQWGADQYELAFNDDAAECCYAAWKRAFDEHQQMIIAGFRFLLTLGGDCSSKDKPSDKHWHIMQDYLLETIEHDKEQVIGDLEASGLSMKEMYPDIMKRAEIWGYCSALESIDAFVDSRLMDFYCSECHHYHFKPNGGTGMTEEDLG